MGLKWVFQFKAVADSQAMMEMQKKLELLQSENKQKTQSNADKWSLHCSLHLPQMSSPQVQTELLIFTFDDNPQKSFHVINTNVLEADKLMISVMERIRLYRIRQTIDVHGYSYRIGDFQVKIGTVILGTNGKAIIMEVDYLPATFLPPKTPFDVSHTEDGNKKSILFPILENFINEVIGPFASQIQVNFNFDGLEYGANFTSNTPGNIEPKEQPNESTVEYGTPYTWQHTTWQYVQLFKSLNLLT